MTEGFALDPRLAGDSESLWDWPLCNVRLANDRRFPWLILVPRVARAREPMDLSPADQGQLWSETLRAGTILRSLTSAHKINLGMLGNIVEQLHVHVIARFLADEAWPGPIWGQGTRVPYDEGEKRDLRDRLIARLRQPAS